MKQQFEQTSGGVFMPVDALKIGGRFTIEHYRKGELIDVEECKNLVVNEGLNAMLDTMLHGSAQVTTWYLGLFEGNYTPVSTVTAATITAASTETTAYDETTRVAYDEAAASAQVTTNAANKATFTFNATKTIYGAFLVSAAAKSATTGTLLAAARFASSKAVAAADQLLLTYALSLASA